MSESDRILDVSTREQGGSGVELAAQRHEIEAFVRMAAAHPLKDDGVSYQRVVTSLRLA